MQLSTKMILIWLGIFAAIFILFNLSQGSMGESGGNAAQHLAYSDFLNKVEAGDVKKVVIRENSESGTRVQGQFSNGDTFQTQGVNDPKLVETLRRNNVKFSGEPASSGSDVFVSALLSSWPLLLMIVVYIWFMRQMQSGKGGGSGGAMGFGKSRAKLLNENHEKKTFDDVAGIDEAKDELQEIVEFLKNPGKYQKLGGKIPRGCLLVGPPGTGKTLLARAIAGEAGVPFFSISGSDFVEMFVGVGASRVRDMFEQGKKNSPVYYFHR